MTRYVIICLVLLGLASGCTRVHNTDRVRIETSLGDIEAVIFTEQAPVSAGNFLELVRRGVYDGRGGVFYRVTHAENQPDNPVKIDVVQGGLFRDTTIRTTPIRHETTAETGLSHKHGALSLARAEPGTAGTEFFICIGDQPELDFGGKRNPDGQGFAVFGQVTRGMEVVAKIQRLDADGQYLTAPVFIRKISRIE